MTRIPLRVLSLMLSAALFAGPSSAASVRTDPLALQHQLGSLYQAEFTEQALAVRLRYAFHIIGPSTRHGLQTLFHNTRCYFALPHRDFVVLRPAVDLFDLPTSTFPSLWRFAGNRDAGSGGEESRRKHWPEDEPQLRKRNAYGEALRQLLHGSQVSQESIERRLALKKIGPDLERYVRWLLRKRNVGIGILPLGSSLKGYADAESDVEFTVYIVNGFDTDPSEEESEKILQKGVALLRKQGYRAEPRMRDIATVGSFSSTHIKRILPTRADDLLVELQEGEWGLLFLPGAYATDVRLLEKARTDFISYLLREQDIARSLWQIVQNQYWSAVLIETDRIEVKPHLKRWLGGLAGTELTEPVLGSILKRRATTMGLPPISVMNEIYLRNDPGPTHHRSLIIFAMLTAIEIIRHQHGFHPVYIGHDALEAATILSTGWLLNPVQETSSASRHIAVRSIPFFCRQLLQTA